MGTEPGTATPVVTTASVTEAADRLAGGARVVLVVEADRAAEAFASLRPAPGALSVFLGDPADPDVAAAAAEMARELCRP